MTSDGTEYSRLGTKAVQSGEAGGRVSMQDCLTTPIAQTSAYTFKNTQQLIDFNEQKFQSYEYGRYGNPTTKVLENKLKALEGAEACLFSSSGMNSCTTMILALVPKGGHIITTKDCYRRTRQFVQNFLSQMDITYSVIDLDTQTYDEIEAVLVEEKPQLFFSESPTNPFLRCVDVRRLASACKKAGTILCIDATFATPINQRPIEQGADLVLHSATKYLAGHNDVLAGALCGSADLVSKVRDMHHILGGTLDPHAAYLVLRGLKTLQIRIAQQNSSALQIAHYLSTIPHVEKVWYPGLPSHPDYDVARQQMNGFGGVISFVVKGGLHPTAAFIDALKIPYIAPSLGGVESLVEQPAIISYYDRTPEERQHLGIVDGLVRFSVGIEDPVDLLSDFAQAFKHMATTVHLE
jgi:cystathionine gamma-synthase